MRRKIGLVLGIFAVVGVAGQVNAQSNVDRYAARVHFNSIPPSDVVVDGRVIGTTPVMSHVLAPGTHTVVFVHRERGKKSKSFTVKAGETKTIAVKLEREPIAPPDHHVELVDVLPAIMLRPKAARANSPADLRRAGAAGRDRKLLVDELTGLERLLSSTARRSPDRSKLIRRLAEAHVDLEYVAEYGAEHGNADDQRVVQRARAKAIEYYRVLKRDYPSEPRLDEVLFWLAFAYQRDGDTHSARATYRELIEKFPASPYVRQIPDSLRARGDAGGRK